MFKDSGEDIYDLNSGFLGIYVDRIRVLIVGGGRVGYLKAKGLLNQGIIPDVVSRDFIDDFNGLNINLIKDEATIDLLSKYHFIVVAAKEYKDLKNMLDKLNKLYVICSDREEGNSFMPAISKNKGFTMAITSNGSPKGAVFLRDKLLKIAFRYEDFLYDMRKIREEVKKREDKEKILDFIYSDDFYFFYLKKKHKLVLNMFFGGFL